MDPTQNLWICTSSDGVYRFDGERFKNYEVPISIGSRIADQKGNLGLGGAGGVYPINGQGVLVNVPQIGPWK